MHVRSAVAFRGVIHKNDEQRVGSASGQMPPIESSLRGSLLTGASALALSVSWGAGAHAQSTAGHNSPNQAALPTWTVWVEGGGFETTGGSFNVPSFGGLGAPLASFNSLHGIEGAAGFDYRWSDPVWHFVFDLRYGRTKTATRGGSSSNNNFQTLGTVLGPFLTVITQTRTTHNSTTDQATNWESHAVADFMIGRDLGVGATAPQVQVGIRVADLYASGHAQETTNSTTHGTFYTFSIGVFHTDTSASSSESVSWNSRFFGAGPRLAITGSIPVLGFWSFDYGAGIAELIGDRSFHLSATTNTGTNSLIDTHSTVFVFNADGWGALSYAFTPNTKVSLGVRDDFYNSALTTINTYTGGLQSLDRAYWGPFLRLTGAF